MEYSEIDLIKICKIIMDKNKAVLKNMKEDLNKSRGTPCS